MITSQQIQIVMMADITRLRIDMAEAARIVEASTSKMVKALDKAQDALKDFGKAVKKISFDDLTDGTIAAAAAAEKMTKAVVEGKDGLAQLNAEALTATAALAGNKEAMDALADSAAKAAAAAKKAGDGAKEQASLGEQAKGALKKIGSMDNLVSVGKWIADMSKAAEAAGHLAKRTGLAVEDLGGLELAFKVGGAGGDALASTMDTLSSAIAGGNRGLAALGLSTVDSTGALVGNKEMLYQVADAFDSMEDGANKTAMAVAIFGDKGAELVPMLNGGAEGLRKMDDMAKSLGLSMSQETVTAATAFNDNLELLKAGAQGLGQGLMAELLPTLSNLSGEFLTTMTSGDRLKNVATGLSFVLKGLYAVALVIIEVFSLVGKVIGGIAASMMTQITGAISVIGKILKGDFAGAWSEAKSTVQSMGAVGVATFEGMAGSLKDTGKSLGNVFKEGGNASVDAAVKTTKAQKDLLAAHDAKVAKQKAEQQQAAELKKQQDAFIGGLQKEVDSLGKSATELKMNEAATLNLTDAQKLQVKTLMEAKVAHEEKVKAEEAAKKAEEQAVASAAAKLKAIKDETDAQNLKIATYGKLPEQIAKEKIADLEKSLQSTELNATRRAEISAQIEALNALAVAKEKADGLGKSKAHDDAKAMLGVLTEVDTATKAAASGMAAAFGKVGSAIGGVATALTGYSVAQAKITSDLEAFKLDPKNSDEDKGKAEITAAKASAQARIKGYGDMAGAAKGFFKENSKGYKLMEGTEKAFRAYETAMAIQSMLTKSGLLQAFTGLFVASKTAETAATTASVAPDVAASMVKGTAAAAAGVAGQAQGDPYTAWARMAAMVAAMAALGFATGGGGGQPAPTTFEEKQKTQGTGTVLGDDTAKSESIAKSLEQMENYASLELDYQNGMLTALRNIESALGGAAKNIMQTTGITGGSAFGTVNSSSSNFFGSDKSTTIADSGVKLSGTFGALRSAKGKGVQYEDVIKTTDGGWFHGDKTTKYTNTKNLSQDAMKPLALIFDNMGDLLADAGVKLGKDGDTLTRALNSINVGFEVSLRNLKGQELADALAAGVSVAFDKVTRSLFPNIAQFQKMGEGLGETLVRVANDVSAVGSVFAAMGKSSVAMSMEAKVKLVEAAGGLDQFAGSAASFMKNFFTDAEQTAATKARLKPVLDKVGLSTEGPQAQKMFRDFVIGLDTSTAAGANTYAMLMNVQQAFKDVTDAAAGERKDLLDELDEMTLSEVQLLNKQRNALDASNRALFDQVQAMRTAKEAQDAAKSSLGDVIGKMKSFGDSARALRDSLLTGGLTVLSPEQQYAETRRQYQRTLAAARNGDASAQSGFSSSANAFLTASQKINSSDAMYSSDFASVLQASEDIAQWTAGQIDVAQASLDALNAQVAGINALNATMQGVERGVDALLNPQALVGVPDYRNMGTPDMAPLVAEIKGLREEVKTLRAEQQQQTGDMIASNARVAERSATSVVEGTVSAATGAAWANRNRKVNLL